MWVFPAPAPNIPHPVPITPSHDYRIRSDSGSAAHADHAGPSRWAAAAGPVARTACAGSATRHASVHAAPTARSAEPWLAEDLNSRRTTVPVGSCLPSVFTAESHEIPGNDGGRARKKCGPMAPAFTQQQTLSSRRSAHRRKVDESGESRWVFAVWRGLLHGSASGDALAGLLAARQGERRRRCQPVGQNREGLPAGMTDPTTHPNAFVGGHRGLGGAAVHGR